MARMVRFAVIDMNNLVNRAVHVVKNAPDQREWIGRTYAIVFQSVAKMANKFMADHCIACFDSYSWREEIYHTYKENRKHDLSPKKIETKRISHLILRELVEYLHHKTNMTVLEAPRIEADDFIARFVQRHQDSFDSHVIVSNDADFKQLVGPGVDLYDPIPCVLYTSDGVYYQDDKRDASHPTASRYGETWKIRYATPRTTLVYRYDFEDGGRGQKGSFVYPVKNYPCGEGHRLGDLTELDQPIRAIRFVGEQNGWEYLTGAWMRFPILTERTPLLLYPNDRVRFIQWRETFNARWELFLKCIRGDARDNIRASYPRVPETRLRKAFGDKADFVKLINDSFGDNQLVKPLFEQNQKLIDLTAQPDDIIAEMDRVIDEMTSVPIKQMVELYFDDFARNVLHSPRLLDNKATILPVLSKPYPRNQMLPAA